MEETLLLDKIQSPKPPRGEPDLHEKLPSRYGARAVKIKKWTYDPQHFTYGNGKPLATISDEVVLLIQFDNGETVVDYSGFATSQGWRADIFVTALLCIGQASFAQYPLPVVQCFCGTQNVQAKATIDPSYFDITDTVRLNY
jgi:hypothetical protein